MNPLRRTLTGAAVASLAALALPGRGSAADATAAGMALLNKYLAAVNAHDTAALAGVIAPTYVQHEANSGRGLAGMQAAFQRYFQMFPDFHMALEDSVIAGDKVVARFLVTATHEHPVQLGPNAPVFPPTGKQLAWEAISIWRVADGKFVEHWAVDDLLSLVQQMRPPQAQGR